MKIIDLDEHNQPLYFVCLEDWSDEMKEAGNHKARWYAHMTDRGLRVKLALDDAGNVGGMIQYLPVECAVVEGQDLYFITCIWVHGHKKGRGNFQKRGMGKALLQAAEHDVKALGAKGIAAWGVRFPFWMKASWFRKQGFAVADRDGMRVLLWKPFTPDAVRPAWMKQIKSPASVQDKVTVTGFHNGWCPALNISFERAKRAVSEPEIKDKIMFQDIDTLNRDIMLEWGISDGLFIDGKEVRTGPPPSYKKIRKLIYRKTKRVSG